MAASRSVWLLSAKNKQINKAINRIFPFCSSTYVYQFLIILRVLKGSWMGNIGLYNKEITKGHIQTLPEFQSDDMFRNFD